MSRDNKPLDRLVAAVQKSPKHNPVCEEFVRHVGAAELPKRRNLKTAIKCTKNKLHQVGSAFLEVKMDYDIWLADLARTFQDGDLGTFRAACGDIMGHHASTRERLTILDTFYTTTLADLAPGDSVLDIACGLSPLAIPWMPLAPGAVYHAYDIYHDMINFLNGFFRLTGTEGRAHARDVIQFLPPEKVDVPLILKTIPCLDQIDKTAGRRLLEGINADHVLVSFPAQSLGGYDKGMVEHYEARLHDLINETETGADWPVKRFEFDTELAFLITKQP